MSVAVANGERSDSDDSVRATVLDQAAVYRVG